MKILGGKELAEEIKKDLKGEVEELEGSPKLSAVLMNNDDASQTYVNMKKQASLEIGMDSEIVELDPAGSESDILSAIRDLNQDPETNGILVQLPLPDHISTNRVVQEIDPIKDVDGLHPKNLGLLVQGNPQFLPATPKGIQRLLKHHGIETAGKDVTVINRSNIVGKPIGNMLIQDEECANSTVTICHKNTEDLEKHTKNADIIITAVGKPGFIDSDMVSEKSAIIDVGIKRVESDNEKGYEIKGDADLEDLKNNVSAITPAPGGVGPMTVAMVLENTLKAYRLQKRP